MAESAGGSDVGSGQVETPGLAPQAPAVRATQASGPAETSNKAEATSLPGPRSAEGRTRTEGSQRRPGRGEAGGSGCDLSSLRRSRPAAAVLGQPSAAFRQSPGCGLMLSGVTLSSVRVLVPLSHQPGTATPRWAWTLLRGTAPRERSRKRHKGQWGLC